MENNLFSLEKLQSELYDIVLQYDGELSQYERLIESLEDQISHIEHVELSINLRAALNDARVLANNAKSKRDLAIERFEAFVKYLEVERRSHYLLHGNSGTSMN